MPRRPSSAAYKTTLSVFSISVVYTADEGPHGRNDLQPVINRHCDVIAHSQFAYIVCAYIWLFLRM